MRLADRLKAAVAAVLAPPVRDRAAAIGFAVPAALMMGNHADRGVPTALGLAAGLVLFSVPIAVGRRRPLLAPGLLAGLCLVGVVDSSSTLAGLVALGYVLWIAQEALTNVVKHAATDHAHLLVRRTPDTLVVQVTDHGGGAGRGYRPGHGLLGMRERALVHGGTLDAAPLPEGGFRVRAVLPLGA